MNDQVEVGLVELPSIVLALVSLIGQVRGDVEKLNSRKVPHWDANLSLLGFQLLFWLLLLLLFLLLPVFPFSLQCFLGRLFLLRPLYFLCCYKPRQHHHLEHSPPSRGHRVNYHLLFRLLTSYSLCMFIFILTNTYV